MSQLAAVSHFELCRDQSQFVVSVVYAGAAVALVSIWPSA